MKTDLHFWLSVAVISGITALLRFFPFIIFSGNRKTPKIIEKLGKTLPYAVIGMLIVYCLKDMSFASISGFLPQIIAGVATALLYIWKRNTLLSIIVGTVGYMLLVQFVF